MVGTAATIALLLAACGDAVPLVSESTPTRSPSPGEALKPDEYVEFDGVIHGWRIAPGSVLEKEFGNDIRNLQLDCDARQVGSRTATDLDIDLSYFPESAKAAGSPNVVKWVCEKIGLSVYYGYVLNETPYRTVGEDGELRLDRFVTGRRAYAISADVEAVKPCTVAGRPAVCVRHNDDEGKADIIVIEDDTLDPFATILLASAFGVPFDELVKTIEGIK